MSNILEVRGLSKMYRSGTTSVEVFRNITFDVAEGEVVALTGASGSGKTTLLNIIGTLDTASSGTVMIGSHDLTKLSPAALASFRNTHIGFIFQFHHLLPEFTATENVAMPALIAGMNYTQATKQAATLLDEVGLSSRSTHRPSELSGGEAQRVAVARAFIMRPTLVLADEPTGNLDPENSDKLFQLILSLSAHHKQTFLIATHNLELAHSARRCFHIENGSISS